ncbi:hypothetical protein NG702_08325 [Pseudarthrobacter sp. MDT3-28]|uniref:hypothetical protein n=1 Tax=Pseudarthrobacter raffinosi TaxID=2953651 RepID=UPI00208E7584|nr:hypothetical protein [Pseudarthrobacter sp. MDT3-28]MCO4237427.1 hypothetical protein [Pseudarthrobacter sp. MDT3-28]
MDDKALTAIAFELYALPFEEFVAARTAAAKAAAGSGKDLPAAVKALPKPSAAAWAVNMLAIHEPGVLAQLSELGQRMRSAQTSLDAAALRELARERRTLLATAVETARAVAERQGRSISATIAADVERTLQAMTADEGATAAVQSGLLVQVLSTDGVDTVDLDGAVAVPGAVPAPLSTTTQGTTKQPPAATAPKEERTTAEHGTRKPADQPRLKAVRETPRPASPSALEKANAALGEAMAAEAESARLAVDRQSQLADTEAEVADLTRETRELRDRLKAAEEQLDSARKNLGMAAAEAKQATRAAGKAKRSAMLAQERVLRLGNTRD